VAARRAADGFVDYPGDLPQSLEEAYAIQDAAIAAWGQPVLGWKVGRITGDQAERFGVDRLAGPVFAVTEHRVGTVPPMPVFAKGFAAGEAEFLLHIGSPPPTGKVSYSLREAADLIDAVHVGIEIASSPLKTINEIGPVAVISDFGNNNGLLVGAEIPGWRAVDFENWRVETLIDGDVVGRGCASAFPDGAIGAARFLFELTARRDVTLEAGQWISTGAVTGVHDARPGQTVEARFNGSYRLACRLVAERGE
jgi:2-keto-4-pentenoate hydratase